MTDLVPNDDCDEDVEQIRSIVNSAIGYQKKSDSVQLIDTVKEAFNRHAMIGVPYHQARVTGFKIKRNGIFMYLLVYMNLGYIRWEGSSATIPLSVYWEDQNVPVLDCVSTAEVFQFLSAALEYAG